MIETLNAFRRPFVDAINRLSCEDIPGVRVLNLREDDRYCNDPYYATGYAIGFPYPVPKPTLMMGAIFPGLLDFNAEDVQIGSFITNGHRAAAKQLIVPSLIVDFRGSARDQHEHAWVRQSCSLPATRVIGHAVRVHEPIDIERACRDFSRRIEESIAWCAMVWRMQVLP